LPKVCSEIEALPKDLIGGVHGRKTYRRRRLVQEELQRRVWVHFTQDCSVNLGEHV